MGGRSYPFPLGMNGTCYELSEGAKTRFFEIFHVAYNPNNVERLKKIDCLNESVLGEFLRHINTQLIDESTFFLYKLETYYGNPSFSDAWDFNEAIAEYETHYFAAFDAMEQFCKVRWEVDPMKFTTRQNTHIP